MFLLKFKHKYIRKLNIFKNDITFCKFYLVYFIIFLAFFNIRDKIYKSLININENDK